MAAGRTQATTAGSLLNVQPGNISNPSGYATNAAHTINTPFRSGCGRSDNYPETAPSTGGAWAMQGGGVSYQVAGSPEYHFGCGTHSSNPFFTAFGNPKVAGTCYGTTNDVGECCLVPERDCAVSEDTNEDEKRGCDDPTCSGRRCDSNGDVCVAGVCKQCSYNNECATGFCVAGVCCDVACPNGVCNFTGQVGRACFFNDGELCGNPSGAQCRSGNCVSGVCCASASCPGGICNAPGRVGLCTQTTPVPTPAPLGQGQSCVSAGAVCAAGLTCVDGVCCGTSCSGVCQSCNQPGQLGTCSPICNRSPGCVSDSECASSAVACTNIVRGWSGNACRVWSGTNAGVCENGASSCLPTSTAAVVCDMTHILSATCGSAGCKKPNACVAGTSKFSADTIADICFTSVDSASDDSCPGSQRCDDLGTCVAVVTPLPPSPALPTSPIAVVVDTSTATRVVMPDETSDAVCNAIIKCAECIKTSSCAWCPSLNKCALIAALPCSDAKKDESDLATARQFSSILPPLRHWLL
jgi:hypothetical protein